MKKGYNFRFSESVIKRIQRLIDHFDDETQRHLKGYWQRVTRTSVLEALVNAEFEKVEALEREQHEKQMAILNETKQPKRNKAKVRK